VGVPVRIEPGRGPVVDEPVRDEAAVSRLRPLRPDDDVPYVLDTVRLLRNELSVPLIGFAGAPFTLASYLVEGGPSRTFARTKSLMHSDPAAWDLLMDRLLAIVVPYLRAQALAGAEVLQVFDSWVGALDEDDYAGHVLPVMRRLFEGLSDLGIPVIHFGVGTGDLLGAMREAGGDAIGVDHRTRLDVAWDRIGGDRAIQGNLDPAALLAPWDVVERKAKDVISRAGGRDGHVFNLGHGVLPETPVGNLQRLVDLVHEETAR
jgi:uroporphyrinogen decarboxylase